MITFDKFVKEGLFSSEYKNIVNKIYNYIMDNNNTFNLTDINIPGYSYETDYRQPKRIDTDIDVKMSYKDNNLGTIILKFNMNTVESKIKIKLKKSDIDASLYSDYYLYVDDIKMDVKNMEAMKLFKALEKRVKSRIKNDKDGKLNKIF